jgi:prophage regulatory protein
MHDASAPNFLQALQVAITQAIREAISGSLKKWEMQPRLVMRIDEVAGQLGLSPSTIRNFGDSKGPWFDPEFPKPIRLGNGAGVRSAIGWRRTDIEAWVNSRPAHEALHQVNKQKSSADPPPDRAKSSRTFRSKG